MFHSQQHAGQCCGVAPDPLTVANCLYCPALQLKMWVERGKEDEARAEKEKLNAPPPSVGSLSAASSTTSLATMSDAAGPAPAPNFSR